MNPHYLSVCAGAAYLDAVMPDWQGKISLDVLDMRMSARCILGQLHGDFDYGQEVLGLSHKLCSQLGFGVSGGAPPDIIPDSDEDRKLYYAELTAEWLRYFYDHLLSIYEEEHSDEDELESPL